MTPSPAVPASLPDIHNKINNAENTGTGVPYEGVGGLQEILNDITDKIGARGLVAVATIGQVATSSPVYGQILLVAGTAIYCWLAAPAQAGDIPSAGGVWRPYGSFARAPFVRTGYAGSTDETFTLTHNLNTLCPTVQVYNAAGQLLPIVQGQSTTPFTKTNYSYSATDANNISFDATMGTVGAPFTIFVKQ